jgi:hypothetical protein
VGVGLCVVVTSLPLAFLDGFCDVLGWGCKLFCMSSVVDVRFRVVGMVVWGVGSGVTVGVGKVFLLRGERVRIAGWGGVVRLRIRLLTNVSSSPVSMYLRWDRDNDSACCWVCWRVGMRPWYIVVRLMRSMCIPHVQPSVCWGVL